ncbi:MAG: TIGR00725 family protein [Bifidobacteriaceae bacterium]|jgi:uncharacterized protein (TIGR00725 family)|nr:TIGR00725 family protein [Bifidobacteriaceae bacterium]
MKQYQIAVIGSAGSEEYPYDKPLAAMFEAAEKIGQLLAVNKLIVVCGGKGGVMEAVSRGAKSAGGITVAEIAGLSRWAANDYIDVEIVTGDLAFRGPSQLIAMSDAVIALGGGSGTLQEICVAYRLQKPIILLRGFGGWVDKLSPVSFLDERRLVKFYQATTPENAVQKALSMLK